MKDEALKLIELAERAEKLLEPLQEVFDELSSIQLGINQLSNELQNTILLPDIMDNTHKVHNMNLDRQNFSIYSVKDIMRLIKNKLHYLQENKESAMMYLLDRKVFKTGDIVELTNKLNYKLGEYIVESQNLRSNEDYEFNSGMQFLVLDTTDKFKCRLALLTKNEDYSNSVLRKRIFTITKDQLMSNFILDHSTGQNVFKLEFIVNGLSQKITVNEVRLYKDLKQRHTVEGYNKNPDLVSNYILFEESDMFGHVGTVYFVGEVIKFKEIMLFVYPNTRVGDSEENGFMGYSNKKSQTPYQLNWNITKRNRIQGILNDETNKDMVLNILDITVLSSKSNSSVAI